MNRFISAIAIMLFCGQSFAANVTNFDDVYRVLGIKDKPAPYCKNEMTKSALKKYLRNLSKGGKIAAASVGGAGLVTGALVCSAFPLACGGAVLLNMSRMMYKDRYKEYLKDADYDKIAAETKKLCKKAYPDVRFDSVAYQACYQSAFELNSEIFLYDGKVLPIYDNEGKQTGKAVIESQAKYPITETDILLNWNHGGKIYKKVEPLSFAQDRMRYVDEVNKYCLVDNNIIEDIRTKDMTIRDIVDLFIKASQNYDGHSEYVMDQGYKVETFTNLKNLRRKYGLFFPDFGYTSFIAPSTDEQARKQEIKLKEVLRFQYAQTEHLDSECGIKDFNVSIPFRDKNLSEVFQNSKIELKLGLGENKTLNVAGLFKDISVDKNIYKRDVDESTLSFGNDLVDVEVKMQQMDTLLLFKTYIKDINVFDKDGGLLVYCSNE